MSDQLTLFDEAPKPEEAPKAADEERMFFERYRPVFESVLDRNTISHKHLQYNKNKGYSSVQYRGGNVFVYKLSKKVMWFKFPIRAAHLLPSGLDATEKDGEIKIVFQSEPDIDALRDAFAAVLDDAIDAAPREFSCCSRYQECSNAGACVNPDKELALDCRYKINLKHGRNYYKTPEVTP